MRPIGATKQLRQDLEHASDRSSEALARWAKRSGLADELKIELTGYLDTAYAKVLDRVDQLGDDEIGTSGSRHEFRSSAQPAPIDPVERGGWALRG